MSRVTTQIVDHVAELARLSLQPEERETFARQLAEIVAYAESLSALDVSSAEPMSHAAAREVLRPDVTAPGLPRADALAQAPDPAAGFFRVPRVIGG